MTPALFLFLALSARASAFGFRRASSSDGAAGDSEPGRVSLHAQLDGLSLPDVSGLSLPDVSGLSLPDVSGLSMPDVSGLSMPEVKMPEGLPAMPETKATIPDLPPMPTMGF